MMIGMMLNAPCSACTISRVTGCAVLPYHSPVNQSEKPALMTPMNSSTKKAGLRKTNTASKRARAHSWASRVARSVRGAGRACAVPATGAMAMSAGLAAALPARTSKWNTRQAMANSTAATPVHSRRLASSTPSSGGSSVLRSAAVQYLVRVPSADRAKGSVSEAIWSSCWSRSQMRETDMPTSSSTVPT
jgi:hypothetical protein